MSKLLPTNEIVARITGIGRRMFSSDSSDSGDFRQSPSALSEMATDMVDFDKGESPRPRKNRGEKQISVTEAIQEMKLKARGSNAAFDYPKATDSQDEKVPGHKMADQDVDDEMYGSDDQDSEPETIKKATSESVKMKKFIKEHIHSMDTFRTYAGLPLVEDKSGEVPTAGVNKTNKMKAGLSGLEGDSLQAIEPEDMEDDVGSDQYTVLDQHIAMLKKEGVDTDSLWGEFLENRGLTVDLFRQLVDEAMESDDSDEMDALLAVEELFYKELPKFLPEGLWDRIRGTKKPEVDTMAALRRTGAAMNQLRQQGVSQADIKAANSKGVAPSAGMAKPAKVHLVRPADAPPEEAPASYNSPADAVKAQQMRRARQSRPTIKMQAVKMGESIEECACSDMAKAMKPAKKNGKLAKLGAKYSKKNKK